MFSGKFGLDGVRQTGIEAISRLATKLQVPVSAFDPIAPLIETNPNPVGLDGQIPVDLELAQVLDRMTDVETRVQMERLLRTLEARR